MHAVLALGFGLLQTADTANAVDESMRTAGVSQNDRHDDLIALRGIGNTDREGAVVGAHEGSIFEVQGDVQLGAGRALPDFGCSIAEECSRSPSRPTMQPLP